MAGETSNTYSTAEDFETVRDALNYSHDPDPDRPYLAFLALDAIEAENKRLRDRRVCTCMWCCSSTPPESRGEGHKGCR